MNIAEFSVKNKIFVNMIFIALFIAGVVEYFRLPMELWPNVTLSEALLITTFKGASPIEVEKLVTKKIEEELSDLADVDYIESRSLDGFSIIHIVFEPALGDIDKALSDLRSEVDKVRDLPEEAETPEVIKLNSDDFTPVMLITIGGEVTENELREIADDLRRMLLDIDGISSISVNGVRDREIWVELDPDWLKHFALSPSDVISSLEMANLDSPGGSTRFGKSKLVLRTLGEYGEIRELEESRITSPLAGTSVPLRSIATVRDTVEKVDVITRLNGHRAATLSVTKKKEASIGVLSRKIRKQTEEFIRNLKVPVEYSFRQDTSIMVEETLSVLRKNAALGAVLVGILLFVFLGARNAALAIIGIPFTFLCAFLFMSIAGISINWLSLFALVLILGIVVDDAIFVIENVFKYVERGMPLSAAAVKGTREIMYPVISSVLTTVAAFLPMIMMTGLLGRFLVVIPKTIIFALLASLMEALLILPSHIAEFTRPMGRKKKEIGPYIFMRRIYRKTLFVALRYRYAAVFAVLVFAALCALLLTTLDVELFTEEDMDLIIIQAKTIPGTALEETDKIAKHLESVVMELGKDELQGEVTSTGMMIVNYRYWRDSHLIEINADLTRSGERSRSDLEIIQDLRERMESIPGLTYLAIERPENGPPTGPPVEVRVMGKDFDVLEKLAQKVKEKLASYEVVTDIRDDYDLGKNEARVLVDKERAALFGVSVSDIAMVVRTAFDGIRATSFRGRGAKDVDVVVKFSSRTRDDVGGLKRLWIPRRDGGTVPLTDVSRTVFERGLSQIRHRDGERTITVSANLLPGVTSTAVNRRLGEDFTDFSTIFPGYKIEFGGEYEETQKSFHSMYRAIALALLLIYSVLVIQFQSFSQPIIVMFTVPFSFIGVVVGLVVMRMKFNMDALIAILALSGIVVNSSLVLVDFMNNCRRRGVSRWTSIAWSGRERMRPIFLTASTTILGLLPMALGLGGTSETWGPMATSIVWGLLFASLLTLFIIPSLYAILDDLKGYFGYGHGRK